MQECNCGFKPSWVGHHSFCNSIMGKRAAVETTKFEDCAMIDEAVTRAGGLKFDGGKPRMELLILGCPRALEGVADVLTFGANKYAAHSWREVEDGINRYIAANHRHWIEIGKHGLDSRDEESGKLHIDHINTNGMFISELIRTHYGIK
jgi:hypothetical protein